MNKIFSLALTGVTLALSASVGATPFTFSTGDPDGKIATASRPSSPGKIEIESADDFLLSASAGLVDITGASFTGLLTGNFPTVTDVRVEIYRIFPQDSDVTRTPQVPTRVNSPSDVALADRDSAGGGLTFTTSDLGSFTASNSVQTGINKKPNQQTGGDGPVTGNEVVFNVDFATPFVLPLGHYFFIPQVQVDGGEFLWLSAPKPIVAPGTPFLPDLQSWIRDENLAPDWLRVGTDIVGPSQPGGPAPTFNASFSLTGSVPEPATLVLAGAALAGLALARRRRR